MSPVIIIIGEKENEFKSIRSLKEKLQGCMWDMRTVQVIPIVVGSLGSVTKNLDKWLEKLDKRISISLFKKLRY